MTNFADRLNGSIEKTKSLIVAGFDPTLEQLPGWAMQSSAGNDRVFEALKQYAECAFEAIDGLVAAVKPNIAFFESYGISGLRAFKWFCDQARKLRLPVIADIKRGDIGNTAEAYARAYLTPEGDFSCDAITINPYLGLETMQPYLKLCVENGRGVFVLVRTSNPDAATLQDAKLASGESVTERVARWVCENSAQLIGKCGLSALGAVVGATDPAQARALRALMPNNYFLIPGMGAQGGSAEDAVAGLAKNGRAGIINISRGLFANLGAAAHSRTATLSLIKNRCLEFNQQINGTPKF